MKRILILAISIVIALASIAQHNAIKSLPGYGLLPMKDVSMVIRDSEGYLWYALYGGGLCRYNGYQMDMFRSDYKGGMLIGESNTVVCVVEDKSGNIIFGTHRGAYVLNKSDFSVIPIDTALVHNRVRNIQLDKSGGIIIESELGLYCYDKKYHRIAIKDGSLPADTTRLKFTLADSNVGIVRHDAAYNPTTLTYHDVPVDVADTLNRISCVLDDGKGHLYIGDLDGLVVYNKLNGTAHRNSHIYNNVRMMVIRPQGGVYFISGKMGLCECDAKGTVRVLNTNTGFYQLAINKDGKLWVSDLYGGVYSYDPTTAVLTLDSHVSIKEGDIVKGIVCDHDGHIWVVTENFVKEYLPETGKYRILTTNNHHIKLSNFDYAYIKGDKVYLTSDSAYIEIGNSTSQGRRPSVSSIIVDGKKHYTTMNVSKFSIPANPHSVEMQFTTFDYLNAEDVHFRYKVNDGEWNLLPRGVNILSFVNLAKGTYQLEVQATDEGGWMGESLCFTLIKQPHWWETWWAYTFYAVFVITIVIAILRNQRQKAMMSLKIRNLIEELNSIDRIVTLPTKYDSNIEAIQDTSTDSPTEITPFTADAPQSSIAQDFLQKATSLVEHNLDNTGYDIEQFAKDMGTSRAGLYRKFETAGIDLRPTEFIRSIRLHHACQLLKTHEYTVAEIAYKVGFSSASYFNRRFKEVYGVQPLQYK